VKKVLILTLLILDIHFQLHKLDNNFELEFDDDAAFDARVDEGHLHPHDPHEGKSLLTHSAPSTNRVVYSVKVDTPSYFTNCPRLVDSLERALLRKGVKQSVLVDVAESKIYKIQKFAPCRDYWQHLKRDRTTPLHSKRKHAHNPSMAAQVHPTLANE